MWKWITSESISTYSQQNAVTFLGVDLFVRDLCSAYLHTRRHGGRQAAPTTFMEEHAATRKHDHLDDIHDTYDGCMIMLIIFTWVVCVCVFSYSTNGECFLHYCTAPCRAKSSSSASSLHLSCSDGMFGESWREDSRSSCNSGLATSCVEPARACRRNTGQRLVLQRKRVGDERKISKLCWNWNGTYVCQASWLDLQMVEIWWNLWFESGRNRPEILFSGQVWKTALNAEAHAKPGLYKDRCN